MESIGLGWGPLDPSAWGGVATNGFRQHYPIILPTELAPYLRALQACCWVRCMEESMPRGLLLDGSEATESDAWELGPA